MCSIGEIKNSSPPPPSPIVLWNVYVGLACKPVLKSWFMFNLFIFVLEKGDCENYDIKKRDRKEEKR